jgi:hypothetical protein
MTDIRVTGGSKQLRPKLDDVAKQTRANVFESAGLKSDLDPTQLGGNAKKVADELLAKYKSTGGTATHDDIKADAQKLKAALREDWVAGLALGDPPSGTDAKIPANPEKQFVERDGKIELAGPMASPNHGMARLLAAIGVSTKGVPPAVRDRLLDIATDPKINLSNAGDFKKAALALGDVAGATAVVPKGLERPFSDSAPIALGQSSTRVGEAKAPTTTGVGTTANALNALIANRVAGKQAPADAEKLKLVDDLAKSMGVENLTTDQKAQLSKALDKMLTDPANKDAPDPARIMSNAFVHLSRSTGSPEHMKAAAALSHQLEAALKANPDAVATGMLVDNGMAAAVVTTALQSRIQQMATGQKQDFQVPNDFLAGIVGMLERQGVQATGDYRQTLREARQPGSAGVKNTLKSAQTNGAAGAKGAKDAAGAKDAKGAKEAAAAKGAGEAERPFDADRVAKDMVEGVLGKGHLKSAEVEKELAAVLKGVGSNDALATTGALLEAFEQKFGFKHPLAVYVEQLKGGQVSEDLKAQIGQFGRDRVGQDFIAASADPQHAMMIQQGAAQQAAMYAQAFSGMGIQLPGGVYGNVGLPGDAGNMTTAARKQTRAAVGMMILNDPSLSVEDKVMMFVLWMTIFADEDLLDKAKELAEFERKDELRQANLRQANIKMQEVGKVRGDAERALKLETERTAQVKNNPAATPEQKDAADKKLGETRKAFETARGYEVQAQQAVHMLEAPQEGGPLKSRETLSMEMRQMENRRNQLMDFCRAFLEGRNRNMEKIWR